MTRLATAAILLAATLTLGACSAAPTPTAEAPTQAPTATIQIAGLSCPLCASNADKSLLRLDGVFDARTNLTTGEVQLWLNPAASPPPTALTDAVLDAGFTVTRGVENQPPPTIAAEPQALTPGEQP